MKILIHDNDTDFPRRWIEYCTEQQYDFERVNCLSNDIVSKLRDADILLWRWHHENHAEVLAARHIIMSAEQMGIKVFPDFNTCWTYDSKLAQKYQMEAAGAPLVPTFIFFDKMHALQWAEQAEFPLVFKLSKGAGAKNVRLVSNKEQARNLIGIAFGKGFRPVSGHVHDAMGRLRSTAARKRVDWLGKFKRLPSSLLNIYRSNKALGRERGYVYFQEFIPQNQYDTRITVVGDRAFGFIRYVRENDFRASGSGSIDFSIQKIDLECVKIAFDVARRLRTQSLAFDFVQSSKGPMIVEVSYSYVTSAVQRCLGHWDSELNWHEGHTWPQDAILDDIINSMNQGLK